MQALCACARNGQLRVIRRDDDLLWHILTNSLISIWVDWCWMEDQVSLAINALLNLYLARHCQDHVSESCAYASPTAYHFNSSSIKNRNIRIPGRRWGENTNAQKVLCQFSLFVLSLFQNVWISKLHNNTCLYYFTLQSCLAAMTNNFHVVCVSWSKLSGACMFYVRSDQGWDWALVT